MIGIAQLGIVKYPQKITTLGLGSCIGVTMYDKVKRIGGMVHVILPEGDKSAPNRAKYANLGVDYLLEQMLKNGASRMSLVAKMAGGAHMFSGLSQNSDILKVGDRNAAQCASALLRLRIPILARDTGGTCGRTIELNTEDGKLLVKMVGKGQKII